MGQTPVERHEVVIIGAGQAGLAAAQPLVGRGVDVVVLERSARIGDVWRRRYASLRLYSPAGADSLPGMRFPMARFAFPSGAAMGDYLEAYAERFALPVRTGVIVDGLERADGGYRVSAGDRAFDASQVVIATGTFGKPFTPPFAGELDPAIRQMHSAEYRDTTSVGEGWTLVVGLSHSGSDIAHELARAGRRVTVAGKGHGQIPVSIDRWAGPRVVFPIMRYVLPRVLNADTPMGRRARAALRHGGPPLLRYRRQELSAAGVELTPSRVSGVVEGRPQLDDGRVLDVENIVWATGYRPDFSWIHLPVFGDDGSPRHYRGVVAGEPGLYFVGLPFLYSFGSMLVFGAGKDGRYVADRISKRLAVSRPAGASARGAAAS
jgi:putative flavoprotein involved in K+ transport